MFSGEFAIAKFECVQRDHTQANLAVFQWWEAMLAKGRTLGSLAELKSRCSRQQLPQHVWQNPAVQVVIDFNRRIDAQDNRYFVG